VSSEGLNMVPAGYFNTVNANHFDIEKPTGEIKHYVTSRNYYDYKSNKINILTKHIIDNIEVSRIDGIFHTGGYLRQAKPYESEPYYRNQISQYLLFSWVAKFIDNADDLYSYISISLSLVFSFVVTSLVFIINKKYDLFTAAILLYGLLGTNYLIYFSNSFYFLGFTYILPLLLVFLLYKPFIFKNKGFETNIALKVGLAVALVCFLRGMLIFEHITVILSSLIIPIFLVSGNSYFSKIKESIFILGFAIAGFSLSLFVHAARLWAHLGSLDTAISEGFGTALKHAGIGEMLLLNPDYWVQWGGQFSSQLFTFHTFIGSSIYTLNMYDFLLIFIVMSIISFILYKRDSLSDNKLFRLIAVAPIALLSSLSWGVVMSHHNSLPYHLTLNSITLASPFSIIMYMIVGRLLYVLVTKKLLIER